MGDKTERVSEINAAFVQERKRFLDEILAGTQSGLGAGRALTEATDLWLRALWGVFGDEVDVALVAVGGYGRQELGFHSDIDLIFHVEDSTDPAIRIAIENFVVHTREARVRLSHAVRSKAQFEEELGRDIRTAIAYLDARPLDGREVDALRDAAAAHLRSNDEGITFVAQMLGGFKLRGERSGETVYRLEPNLKSGPGGLRDCQAVRWSGSLRFGFDPAAETLVREGWGEQERQDLLVAMDWLYLIRQRLHASKDRKHDRLNFDDQEAVGCALHGDLPVQEAVEALMQEHYRVSKRATKLAERALRRWSQSTIPFTPLGSRFRIDDTQIALDAADSSLTADETFEALRWASQRHVLLDPALELAIETSGADWSDETLKSVEVGRQLAALFTDVETTSRTSTRLLDLGVLARVVTEFAPIVCHAQHDVYHVYTTDVHSLRCLEAGRSLLTNRPDSCGQNWPWLATVASEIADTEVFLLACLFHDIGKNRGGGHSVKGAQMMRDIGPRLGLEPERVELLSFLVLEHLTLSQTARRRDISDPQLILELADVVGDAKRLKVLLALAFCDAFTVGDGVMTDWTASLLHQLYAALLAHFEGSDQSVDGVSEAVRILGDNEDVRAFVSQMPDRLLRDAPPAALRRYMKIFLEWRADARTVVRFTSGDEIGVTEVVVATFDQPGRLASIAGVLASNGLDILAAEIVSTESGSAFDVFRVVRSGQPIVDPRKIAQTIETLTNVLDGDEEVDIAALLDSKLAQQKLAPKARPAVDVNVETIEGPDNLTIFEVHALDRPGLLFDIATTLERHGANIHLSFIDSEGDQVIDTFYVEGIGGNRLEPEEAAIISDALHAALSD